MFPISDLMVELNQAGLHTEMSDGGKFGGIQMTFGGLLRGLAMWYTLTVGSGERRLI